MPVIDIEKAKLHLRVDDDAGDDVQDKLIAAIDIAEQFLNRKVFANAQEMATLKGTIPDLVEQADTQYNNAIAQSNLYSPEYRDSSIYAACQNKAEAYRKIRMIDLGIVINASIEIGILMLLGHLYANREDIVVGLSAIELPKSSHHYLMPYRMDMGV